jgi:hypothetical protein
MAGRRSKEIAKQAIAQHAQAEINANVPVTRGSRTRGVRAVVPDEYMGDQTPSYESRSRKRSKPDSKAKLEHPAPNLTSINDMKFVLQGPPSMAIKIPAPTPPVSNAKQSWEEEDSLEEGDAEGEEEIGMGYGQEDGDSFGEEEDDFGSYGMEDNFDEDPDLGKRMSARQMSIAMRAKRHAETEAENQFYGSIAE